MLGVVTELGRTQDDELNETFRKIIPYWGTPDEGSSTTMVAALDPALNGERLSTRSSPLGGYLMSGTVANREPVDIKGIYLKDCQIEEPAPHAADPEIAERLWHLSEELVGQKFNLS